MTDLEDAILRHTLELQRVSAHDEALADKILLELTDDLRSLLSRGDLSAANRREIAAIIKEADNLIASRYANIAGVVDVTAIVQHVAERTEIAIHSAFPNLSFGTSQQTLLSLAKDILIDGSPASSWWAKQSEDTAFKFAGEVRRGVIEGRTNEQIVRQIVGGRGEPGLMPIARRQARTLVHSSIMTAMNRARLETYREAFGDIAPGVRWLATLDSRTCPTCANLDGKAWDFDGKPIRGKMLFQEPPAHWNCRCVLTPLPPKLDDDILGNALANIGFRASADGPQKRGTTFNEFLDRQSDAWVNEWMGKTRADAYRAGKITLNDLVTRSGTPKSLAQLGLE